MHGLVWSIAKGSVRVELPLLIYGAIFGISVGLLTLAAGSSVDKATALGIAIMIELALGIWLGRWIWLLWLKIVGRVHDLHRARICTLAARIAQFIDSSHARPMHKNTQVGFWSRFRGLLYRVLFFPSVLMTYFGITILSIGSIAFVIDLNADIYDTDSYLNSLAIGATALLIGLMIQAIEVSVFEYRLRHLERDVDKLTSTPNLVSQPSMLWDAYRFTQRFIFVLLAWGRSPRHGLTGN